MYACARLVSRVVQTEWCRPAASLLAQLQQNALSPLSRAFSNDADPPREQMRYDVCIVGAGPSGLSAAIRLKQLCLLQEKELSVCVIEKGSEVGAHILSGNVLEPKALGELFPGLKDHLKAVEKAAKAAARSRGSAAAAVAADVDPSAAAPAAAEAATSSEAVATADAGTLTPEGAESSSSSSDAGGSPYVTAPNNWGERELKPLDYSDLPLRQPVTKDKMQLLTQRGTWWLPVPGPMKNKGNFVISLSELTRWLAARAEDLGVDIFPGIAGKEVLCDWNGAVAGVATGDFGISKSGERKEGYTPGVDLLARVTLFAEGCRGSLSESLIHHYGLRQESGAQTYGLGIKEVWEVPEEQHKPGLVIHTLGYPLSSDTYGGGFLYHMDNRRVALGLVVGLDYPNPWLSPFQEFNRWKQHPAIASHIKGGTCLQYGARALNEGGLQAVPKLVFPGGVLIGCSAGFLNVPKIKGTHTAMKTGMLAADSAFKALTDEKASAKGPVLLSDYEDRVENSWVEWELEKVRNYRPGFRWGLWPGLMHSGFLALISRGKEPWTLKHRHADNDALKLAKDCTPPDYPKPDGEISFDLPTSLYRSGTNHDHDQPPHLVLRNPGLPEVVNDAYYAGPESRYCPAGVYEYTKDEATGRPQLVINAQNCLHCKACDIKDPRQNIKWTVPEGGGGPNYTIM